MLDLTDKYGKYFFTTREDMEEVYKTFVKYGYGIVFFARFIPLGRGFISLPAGSAKMPFWRFLAYSYAGTAIWSTVLVMV
jgi:membrane protein DedA with SNARE-associated domain